ncbi:helix-turn-helix domain-containing protein [Oryzifoliimicrobium ureilyticus]|uniref:helix-turn-helix domain-containing protein n=1 Tax=Oryzifoliimicrobium ureilyticus TaxID=3113724 RepID=UPI0030766655
MAARTRDVSPEQVIIAENALIDFQFAVIKALNENKISQKELAETLGITRARMSQILSSDANPTVKLMGRIVSALGLEARYMKKSEATPQVASVMSALADFEIPETINNSAAVHAGSWFVSGWQTGQREWHNDNRKETKDRRRSGAFAA